MKIFLASRFQEFENLRTRIITKFSSIDSEFGIEIVNLNDSKSDVRDPDVRSVQEVSKADILLLLIGDTYGLPPQGSELSITHMEFEEAKDKIPILSFYVGEHLSLKQELTLSDNENLALLQKEALYSYGTSAFFDSKKPIEEIAGLILRSVIYNYKQFARSGLSEFKHSYKHVPILENLSNIHIPQPNTSEFYSGFKANWGIFANDHDIQREIYDSKKGLNNYFEDPTQQTNKFIIIQGASGTGKSTLLKRIAYNHKDKKTVYFCNSKNLQNGIDIINILNGYSFEPNTIVCVDNIISILNSKDKTFQDINLKEGVVLIGTCHPSDLAKYKNRTSLNSDLKLFTLNALSINECEKLIDKIDELENKNILLKTNENITIDSRKSLISKYFGKHLIIAILVFRHGENIQKLITGEFDRIADNDAKNFYLLSCLGVLLGEEVDEDTLLEKLGIPSTDFSRISIIYQNLAGIVIEEDNLIIVRHQIIARIVYNYFFKNLKDKKRSIEKLLKLSNEYESVAYCTRIFDNSSRTVKRFKSIIEHNAELISNLFDSLLNSYTSKQPRKELKLLIHNVLIGKGVFLKSVRDYENAFSCFNKAEEIIKSSFVLRQKAWIRFEQNFWSDASNMIKEVVEFENNFKNNVECAEILSMSTVESFYNAEQYYTQAEKLTTTLDESQYLERKKKKYQDAKKILDIFPNAEEIPEDVLKILDININVVLAQFESQSKFLKNRLMLHFAKNLKKYDVDQRYLKDILSEFEESNSTKRLRAKYYSNLARYLYTQVYKSYMNVDEGYIEECFKKSLKFDNTDPFTYSWYGTYYKEIKNDLVESENLYRQSIRISEKSQYEFDKRHPLLLNNLALLLVKKINLGDKNVDKKEIESLYLEAITKSNKTSFYWPQINYTLFNEQFN